MQLSIQFVLFKISTFSLALSVIFRFFLNLSWCVGLFNPRYRALHFSCLKFMRFLLAQLSMFLKVLLLWHTEPSQIASCSVIQNALSCRTHPAVLQWTSCCLDPHWFSIMWSYLVNLGYGVPVCIYFSFFLFVLGLCILFLTLLPILYTLREIDVGNLKQ